MIKNFIIVSLIYVFGFNSFAQRATQYLSPVPSPQSFVSQNVGMTKITVSYSSPGMKGRKIFGELVPYGKEWRAGANSPTMLSFSTSAITKSFHVRFKIFSTQSTIKANT